MSSKTIDLKVFRALKVWLQSPVFLDEHIPTEIRITFLQVLSLLTSAKDALVKLKGETLNNFITDMIAQIANRGSEETKDAAISSSAVHEDSHFIKLEDSLLLMTV